MKDNKEVIVELREQTQNIIDNNRKKCLYQKLLEIQKKVKGLGQDSDGNNYKYVSGNKVINAVKEIMNEQGILLKQEVIDVKREKIEYKTKYGKEKTEVLFDVKQKFTWIDCETGEKDENEFFASGMNDWEKGLGSALTYAERYFLLKYFHIATDEDDIDNPDRKNEGNAPDQTKPEKSTQEKAISYITNNSEFEWLNNKLKQYKVNTLTELSKEELKTIATEVKKMLDKQ